MTGIEAKQAALAAALHTQGMVFIPAERTLNTGVWGRKGSPVRQEVGRWERGKQRNGLIAILYRVIYKIVITLAFKIQ